MINTKIQILIVTFIDFSKYFALISTDVLLYKFIKNGIGGKMYNIINDMHFQPSYHVKLGSYVHEPFFGGMKVKQGCTLSPTLSTIFQNDLYNVFGENEDPIHLGNCSISK